MQYNTGFIWSTFFVFGLKTGICRLTARIFRIQSEYGNVGTRKNQYSNVFCAVISRASFQNLRKENNCVQENELLFFCSHNFSNGRRITLRKNVLRKNIILYSGILFFFIELGFCSGNIWFCLENPYFID